MAIQKHSAKLINKEYIGDNILEISLKVTGTPKFDYIPGQFISIHFEHEGKEIKRSYSIANEPSSLNIIKFAISRVPQGLATEYLFNLPLDTELEISGPVGRLVLPEVASENHPSRYVLIATGTGVTPYRAMFSHIKSLIDSHNTQVLLLFGVRNLKECIYLKSFENFANENPNFKFKIFFSRLNENDIKEDNHHLGYIQNNFDKLNPELNPDSDIVYLCGNPNMIDETFEILKSKGFNAKTVKREKYISSK